MEKKLTVGIIGVGRIGKVHTLSIQHHLPQVTVKGVTDKFVEQAKEWAAVSGIKTVYGT